MTSPAKPPVEDVKDEGVEEKLHPLVAIVQQATTARGESSSGGSSNIVVYVVVIGVVVIGFAIMGWLLVRAKRRAAELAFKLRRKEEEQARVAEDATLAENEDVRNKAQNRVNKLSGEIQGLKEKLVDQRKLQATRAKAVADAASWEDLGL